MDKLKGGKLAAYKIKQRDPDFYKKIGRLGGSKSKGGGFASDKVGDDGLTGKQRARVVGKIGGMKPRVK